MTGARNDGAGGSGLDDALARSKAALKKSRAARESLEAAARERERLQRMRYLDIEVAAMILGGAKAREEAEDSDAEPQARLLKEVEERLRENEDELRVARAKEEAALEEVARATEELQEATVEPRVEGLKLRFETSRLQATLAAGLLVAVATLAEVFLPPDPDYAFLMWAAYGAFLYSLAGGVREMRKLSNRVEDVMTGSGTGSDLRGWREIVARWAAWIYERSLTLGLALFALFVALNAA